MSLEVFLERNKHIITTMILGYLTEQTQNNQNYEVVWKEYQTQVCDKFIEYLKENGYTNISVTVKKSTYPEFTVVEGKDKYAFDVKVSVDTQNPSYDIARLDTFSTRLNEYKNEYEVIVKYNINSGVAAVYFESLYNVIGIHRNTKGMVKFRPYDGKVRPKTWEDFDNNKSYFNSKSELIQGIKKAKIFRNKQLAESWKNEFTNEEYQLIIG